MCYCSLTRDTSIIEELNIKNIVTLLNMCATLLISQVTQLPATPFNPHLEEQGLPAFADEPEDRQLLDKLEGLKYLRTNLLIITLAMQTDMLAITLLLQTEELVITLLLQTEELVITLLLQTEELVITLPLQTVMLAEEQVITLPLQADMLVITLPLQTDV